MELDEEMNEVRILVAMLALQPVALGAQISRPDVHVEKGACPFECCTYGRWQATEGVTLRSAPSADAPLAGELLPGDSVTAETGEVRTSPGAFVIKTPYRGFEVGDTIWVLDYRGEGHFNAWYRGETIDADLGFSPYGGTAGARCTGCSHGELMSEHTSEWWVHVTSDSGASGWTSETRSFDGTGSCGCR
jgi:hypothetical protein